LRCFDVHVVSPFWAAPLRSSARAIDQPDAGVGTATPSQTMSNRTPHRTNCIFSMTVAMAGCLERYSRMFGHFSRIDTSASPSKYKESMQQSISHHRAREAQQAAANRYELIERIAGALPDDGRNEPMHGLHFIRTSSPTERVHAVSRPSLCVIAQGAKEVHLGDDAFRYNPAHYLLAVVSLPVVVQIVEASIDRPYLSLALDLDPSIVSSVIVETGLPASRAHISARAIDVSPLESNLLDAVVRLVRLVDSPGEARVMQPLVTREIVYRLLVGAQGDRLRHLTPLGGTTTRIATAVERLRTGFDQPLRIERIANELGMSVSGFHAQFKAVTAMSPLQFQKHIRLQEARRLMIANDLDAASAGHRVGYEDASHFTREYKRLFGEPPVRDLQRLRAAAAPAAEL
jgi:AraC-like DNA-binding protein